ncbi:hypothetical protein DSM106972_095340 [Dulcicalothrix desertica PCC 7102]|uniref:Uncharacterized protein n=2 Tax=Dulcicalothrix desertica TaxID=32056 RepID=A0A3S1A5K6_9CYAN|nr:DUF5995 family protein [Dulcicalothrix desertica]RUS93775.1 hypothetical protein DSM106972_095340 [Dulcicalothrix desertica PCC 7102]
MQSSAFAAGLASIPVCTEGRPECLDLVIQEMEQRYQPLEAQRDRDGIFALSYLRTTETLKNLFPSVGFDNPTSIIKEDALFADYYFRAYDDYHSGSSDVPPAWKIAFDAAKNQTVSGGGNLALGTSAHILRDLPFVLYELNQKGTPISYSDHNLFNQVLLNVNILEELALLYDPTIDDADVPGTEDDLQRFQVVALWRELAFRNYEKLRDAKTDSERALVVAEIEGLSAATATTLFEAFKNPPQSVTVPEPKTAPVLLALGGVLVSITGLKNGFKKRTPTLSVEK